ncbi:MAG: hypothetical protein ABL971_08480 [Vicinamibacterales bacterium]
MPDPPTSRPRQITCVLIAAALFLLSVILRYNSPEGAFGGLTDDHHFYATYGWQLLFGDLPDRDFSDPGFPLTIAISGALQVLERSVWPEYAFCVAALSFGTALTFLLAVRASGSIVVGLGAALFQFALLPRLYNYPKIIIYTVAIPALWAWIATPGRRRTWLVAGVTVFAALLRHDHGAYVGAAFGLVLIAMVDVPWRDRLRHGLLFGVATLVCLAPYLTYLQVNGGIVRHFDHALRWASTEQAKNPLVIPTPSWVPLTGTDANESTHTDWWNRAPFSVLDEHYYVWWTYWLFLLLPFVALVFLVVLRHTGPPYTRQAQLQILVLIALTAIVNIRLLRDNLGGRLADVSVLNAVLGAWVVAAVGRLVLSDRRWPVRMPVLVGLAARVALATTAAAVIVFTAAILTRTVAVVVRDSSLPRGFEAVMLDASRVTRDTERTWPLDMWTNETRGLIGLSKYLNACTAPADRILMVPFFPQVYGLAQRGFAGGRQDLRGGRSDSPEDQRLTVERLRRQSVPIVIGPPEGDMEELARDFPLITEHLRREYRDVGHYDVGDGLDFTLLVHHGASQVGTYEPLGLPCFH